MKKFFTFLLLVAFCSLNAMAQGSAMRIHKTDGTDVVYSAKQVEYFDFTEASGLSVKPVDGEKLVIAIEDLKYMDFPASFDLSLNHKKWCLHPNQVLHLNLYNTEDEKTLPVIAQSWSSSNDAVAAVDAEGVVTAKADGDVTIKALYGGYEAELSISVTTEKAFTFTSSNVTGMSFDFSIEPKDPSLRYYYQMRLYHGDQYSVDSMDDYGSVEENLYYFTKDWYQFVADNYGGAYTWNDALQKTLTEGKISEGSRESYSMLNAGEEYMIYAMGFDPDGNICTPIETHVVQATPAQPSSNTFDVTIDKCLSSDAQFTINPSNNDQYLVCVQRANYVNYFIENDKLKTMAQDLASTYALDSRYPALNRGTTTHIASDFVYPRSDEDYYVIVFGFDEGVTTDVTLKRFRTEAGWVDPGRDIIKVIVPEDLKDYPCSIDAVDEYYDENDNPIIEPIETMTGRIGVKDGKVYLSGFAGAMSDHWIMGTYDADNQTVTFPYPQYVGEFDPYMTGAEPLFVVGGNLETNKMVDLVFDYDDVENKLILQDGTYFVLNQKSFSWAVLMMMKEYTITMTKKLF